MTYRLVFRLSKKIHPKLHLNNYYVIIMIKKGKDKIALITGAREGIGYQTAMQLASRYWTVIMADNQDQTDIRKQIISSTTNDNIFTNYLDLASFKSIRKFVKEIKQKHNRLDVLVNNAGIFNSQLLQTEDNLCRVMQVNHFGPFLLTCLLKDLLIQSHPSRIIFVSSLGAFFHTLSENQLPLWDSDSHRSSILEQTLLYYNSKLCNMVVSKEFANRLNKYNVTSNCLHPGMTSSNLLFKGNHFIPFLSPVTRKLLQLSTQDVRTSAEMITFLATSNSLSTTTAQYFVNYQVRRMPKVLYNCSFCQKVWKQAEEAVNLTDEEKTEMC